LISVGNDIVVLNPHSIARETSPKFYSKFITEEEFNSYDPSIMSFHNYIWLLWSVKEAVYKFINRINPELLFSPLRLAVINVTKQKAPNANLIGEEGRGFAYYHIAAQASLDDRPVDIRSIITDGYIATFAAEKNDFVNMFWGIERIYNTSPANQSAEVRQFALQRLQSLHTKLVMDIKRCNTLPIPRAFANDILMPFIPVSFSHHFNYVAYAFIDEIY
jgi:phosphopantetheine--protein transferase-like protein